MSIGGRQPSVPRPVCEDLARGSWCLGGYGFTAQFAADNVETATAVHRVAQFFRTVGRATHNQVLVLAQEPLLQLLEPSLGVMIDKVPQARSRIMTAQRKISEALQERDTDGARTWMARHIRDFRKGFEIAGIDLEHRITGG